MNYITIDKLCKVIASYQSKPSYYWPSNTYIKYLQLKTTTDNVVNCQNSNESCYTEIQYSIDHYAIKLKDIVVDKQLNVAIVLNLPDIPVLPNKNQYIVRVEHSDFLPEYVVCCLSLKSLKNQLREKLKLGVLTIETLKEINIPTLDLEQQKKVIDVCHQVKYYKQLAQKAIEKIDLIPDAFMNKLIKKNYE